MASYNISLSISADTDYLLAERAEDMGISQQDVVRLALAQYLGMNPEHAKVQRGRKTEPTESKYLKYFEQERL
ncbi:CopG family transcriptional regulator [Dactylosporangium sp. NPDC005572]|uniref:ribbon-helix-helix domain-containing protein n=1 Tax=Dactylosporangium sp. NPDC005572 TaxID=3156889 RepID=UPI0033B065D0